MESMTGYASIDKSTEQFSYSVTIKSLNTKYLDVFTNLPRILRDFESEYIKLLKSKFSRGKIELSIDIYDWIDARPVSVNANLMKSYYEKIERARKKLGIDGVFSLDMLLALDGVIYRGKTSLSDESYGSIINSIELAIKKSLEMRKSEGKSIRKDLTTLLASITGSLGKIKLVSSNVSKDLFRKLKAKLENLSKVSIDEVRLYTEVAILADKLDINEEVTRLTDHIKKFKSTIKEDGQTGKKLDFLAQEMFREINTISSKSNSSDISHHVVDMKNNIDRIREQCRNVV